MLLRASFPSYDAFDRLKVSTTRQVRSAIVDLPAPEGPIIAVVIVWLRGKVQVATSPCLRVA
jgi:hypothetical protein